MDRVDLVSLDVDLACAKAAPNMGADGSRFLLQVMTSDSLAKQGVGRDVFVRAGARHGAAA